MCFSISCCILLLLLSPVVRVFGGTLQGLSDIFAAESGESAGKMKNDADQSLITSLQKELSAKLSDYIETRHQVKPLDLVITCSLQNDGSPAIRSIEVIMGGNDPELCRQLRTELVEIFKMEVRVTLAGKEID